jgi:hypothetical protein
MESFTHVVDVSTLVIYFVINIYNFCDYTGGGTDRLRLMEPAAPFPSLKLVMEAQRVCSMLFCLSYIIVTWSCVFVEKLTRLFFPDILGHYFLTFVYIQE